MATPHKLHFIGRRSWAIAAAASIFIMMSVVGCDTSPADSLFDEDRPLGSDPIISSIEPPEQTLAGIGTITIVGENFSADPDENLVFFDGTRATVLEASPTQLIVRSPNLPKQGIEVKVTVVDAENISNVLTYSLEPAVERFGRITDFEEVFGIATDDEANVYISLFSSNVSAGIKRLSPEGERSDYASSTFKWDALGLDSDGYLYGVRNVRAVFRFPPGGGAAQTWAVADDASARFRSLVVDGDDNVWVAGSGGSIYRIDQNADLTATPVGSTVSALAVAGGFLYAAEEGMPHHVVRRRIEAGGTLGAGEELFAAPDGVEIHSLAVTAEGEVVVGTDADDPLFLVQTNGSSEVFYPGLLLPTATGLAWGTSPTLYIVRGREGGELPDLFRINTQRERPE